MGKSSADGGRKAVFSLHWREKQGVGKNILLRQPEKSHSPLPARVHWPITVGLPMSPEGSSSVKAAWAGARRLPC
jgi:hypothetical protein